MTKDKKGELGKVESSHRSWKMEEGRKQSENDGKQVTSEVGDHGLQSPRQVQEWWAGLSQGERRLICSVMGLLRGAKRSQFNDVANAAAKWERGIGCFIKVRLMNGGSATGKRARASITVKPATALTHSRPLVRPDGPSTARIPFTPSQGAQVPSASRNRSDASQGLY